MSATQHRLDKIKDQYDVVVVGGGIYGATTAWEAASRGLKVVLIEADDFCSGTSANSLKTIHGGLRSLQRFDFSEMREYIRERRALLRIAPHLVSPLQCVIPTYSRFNKSRFFFGLGMKVYDLIASDRNKGLTAEQCIKNTQIISAEQVRDFVPAFDSSAVTGGASWFDAQVYNSERLVLAFIMSAKRAGADVFNYVRKKSYMHEQGKIIGLSVTDQLQEIEININATAIVDCRGPWAVRDKMFIETTDRAQQPALMARAVNIVLNRKLSHCALGVNVGSKSDKNKRLMFIAPWRKGSIVGTWYYPQTLSDNKVKLSRLELSQCLSQINSVFPALKLSREDVTQIHHGLQPAESITIEHSEPKIWRHSKIIKSKNNDVLAGLFWVQGMKLTTARATAENAVDKVAVYLRKNISPSHTSVTALYGGDITSKSYFSAQCYDALSNMFSKEIVERLIKNYGSNTNKILELCKSDVSLAQCVPGVNDTIKAELEFIIKHEMVCKLTDLLLRRTDIGSFECPKRETIEYCADVMATYMQWGDEQRTENINQLMQEYSAW